MHKADIEKLEDMLINQEKYKKLLRFREMELEYTQSENIPDHKNNSDRQDPRTIKAGSNTSTVEKTVERLNNDLEYQTLYSIVCNTPKYLNTLNQYENAIYQYRYREVDLSVYEWEGIAMKLTDIACEDNKSFSKSTTLRLRNKMLERLANHVGYTLM